MTSRVRPDGPSRAVAQRDDTGGREAIDLLARESDLAKHFGGVLAEQRRGPFDARRRSGRASRESQDADRADAGLVHRLDEAEEPHLWVLEYLVKFVDGAGGDGGGLETGRPLDRARRRQNLLDVTLELGVVRDTRLVRGEARIGFHGGIVEGRAEAPPLVRIQEHDVQQAIASLK